MSRWSIYNLRLHSPRRRGAVEREGCGSLTVLFEEWRHIWNGDRGIGAAVSRQRMEWGKRLKGMRRVALERGAGRKRK